ncbi:MAG: hypothetical protein M0Q51_10565 [Bacteroidales bacterium]|nr:hypothetical protein [Bacteroidales bacterium]
MRYLKQQIILFSLLALSLALMSWGYTGHYKINNCASLSFNLEMEQFIAWATTLAEHASDADDRKETDPNEGPRHYIDIDNYPGFLTEGRIPQTYDSVVALYGESFVIDQGVLPWATLTTYDSLVDCFLRRDWAKAVLFASDLGHYVADAHMPLHITRNYSGQYSGNNGIHSRYESTMINAYIGQINYPGDDISFVTDVNGYVFNYLYSNYTYVDSVMEADDYARGVAGNTSSSEYKQALWEKSMSFTVPLFSRASHAMAELIYSAWTEAGKPLINASGLFDPIARRNGIHLQITPNPFKKYARIQFTLPESSEVHLQIVNVFGIAIATIVDSCLSKGSHEFTWDTSCLPCGIYFLSMEAGKVREVRKAIRIAIN